MGKIYREPRKRCFRCGTKKSPLQRYECDDLRFDLCHNCYNRLEQYSEMAELHKDAAGVVESGKNPKIKFYNKKDE